VVSPCDFVAGDDVERERQQPVAGQDRGGVVGLLVQRRSLRRKVACLSIAGQVVMRISE
jgi:hypothetical protein